MTEIPEGDLLPRDSTQAPTPEASGDRPSAFDRVQDPRPPEDEESPGMSWSWLGGLVLLILSVIAVWLWTHRQTQDPEPDLYRLAVDVAREFRPTEITDDPDRAGSFVLEQFGLPLFPPELEGFGLLGVGAAELSSGVAVPAFRYDGADNATIVVFVYDYILLDEAAEASILRLAPEVYSRLAEPEPVDSRRVDDAYVVTWRRRSTIFSAVVPGEVSAEQILQSVRRAEI